MSRNKTKITFLISDNNPGGIFTSTSALVRNMNRHKYQVVVVACGSGHEADRIGALADEYYNLRVGTFPRVRKVEKQTYRENYRAWFTLFFWILKSLWFFLGWIRKHKPDLIHTNTIHFNLIAGIAGRIMRVPSVWHIRWPQNTASQRGWAAPLVALVEGKLAACLANKFIANSRFTASTFHPSWKNKTVVVYNAVDAQYIAANQHPGYLREIAKVESHERLVGVTGIITYRKGMDRFIEMAALLAQENENVKFVIVGGAPQKMEQMVMDDLIQLSKKHKLADKLCFTGNIKNAPLVMGDMDAFFMCSRPNTETFGLVVIEAMAAQVPVVVFHNDAMPEIIESGCTGFLVPEGDILMANNYIKDILNDTELAQRLVENAYNNVLKHYDVPVLIERVQDVYHEIFESYQKKG